MKILQKHFWIILALFIIISLFQYVEQFGLPGTSPPSYHFGLSRHTLDRMLLLIPVIYAAWAYGLKAGLFMSGMALIVSLPRIIFISTDTIEGILEVTGMTGTGVLISVLFWTFTTQRKKADKALDDLEATRLVLESNVDALTTSQRRLAMLNNISTTLFTSLDLDGVFRNANQFVKELMSSDIALLFTMDEANHELKLAASEGIPDGFTDTINWRIKIEDVIFPETALKASPVLSKSLLFSPGVLSEHIQKMDMQSHLVVPVKLKDRVRGIICIAVREPRVFTGEDINLLTSIATQVAVAIENAMLYNEQSQISNRLAVSEGKYRRLFEHASDAIWANDMSGKITIANRASAELMGDNIEEMIGSDVRKFLPPEGIETARKIREILLSGEAIPTPYEQHLIRKDNTKVILMVSSSLVRYGDEPLVFEHVARDVTRERRMQDNLRYYVQQITRTQEEERTRIARDLHDDTVQALYVLTRSLDNYVRRSSDLPADTEAFLKSLHEQVRSVLQSVRRFSQELRPPMLDDLGLLSALRWLLSDMEKRLGINANIDISGTEKRLAPHAELAVFRIVQEALRNVEKHSGASKIDVNVEFTDGKVDITIDDNGKGFELAGELGELPREGRLGLVGMEERARLIGGSVSIKSELNKGTRISIELPV